MEIFEKILEVFNLKITPWIIVLICFSYILHKRILKLIDNILDKLGKKFGRAWNYRRFIPKYNELVYDEHLFLKIIGIRTEEERRPKITEAYVPIKVMPKGKDFGSTKVVEQITKTQKH